MHRYIVIQILLNFFCCKIIIAVVLAKTSIAIFAFRLLFSKVHIKEKIVFFCLSLLLNDTKKIKDCPFG